MAAGKKKGKKTKNHHLAAFKLRAQRKALAEERRMVSFLEDVQRGSVFDGEQTYVTRSFAEAHAQELVEDLGYAYNEDALQALEAEGLLCVYDDADLQRDLERARSKLLELTDASPG